MPAKKPPRFPPAESFGTWLKYLRQLSGLSQTEAANAARVSEDAVRRLEQGYLVGSAHLLAWLAWLNYRANQDDPDIDGATLVEELEKLPEKLGILGSHIRDAGLAIQEPKARSLRKKKDGAKKNDSEQEKTSTARFRRFHASEKRKSHRS